MKSKLINTAKFIAIIATSLCIIISIIGWFIEDHTIVLNYAILAMISFYILAFVLYVSGNYDKIKYKNKKNGFNQINY